MRWILPIPEPRLAAAGAALALLAEAAEARLFPALALHGAARAAFLAAHFLSLQCLALALLARGGAASRAAVLGSSYVTLALHYALAGACSGDGLSFSALRADAAEAVLFGTLWIPCAAVLAAASRRGTGR